MTGEQIVTILSEVGESSDQWTTLENKFKYMDLTYGSNVFIGPQTVQYYFDSENEMLLMRHTYGGVTKVDADTTIPDGYVIIEHDGSNYMTKVEGGGAEHPTAGTFHECVDYSYIAGLFLNTPV